MGAICLWTGDCLRSRTTISQPGMAEMLETYRCPIRNSAKLGLLKHNAINEKKSEY